MGNTAAAITALEELVRRRRYANDWQLLGTSYLKQHELQKSLTALQYALSIRPFRHTVHMALADVYRELGDPGRADEHVEKARWLLLHQQD